MEIRRLLTNFARKSDKGSTEVEKFQLFHFQKIHALHFPKMASSKFPSSMLPPSDSLPLTRKPYQFSHHVGNSSRGQSLGQLITRAISRATLTCNRNENEVVGLSPTEVNGKMRKAKNENEVVGLSPTEVSKNCIYSLT